MNDRLIPLTDHAARALHPLDDLHEPEPGSIVMANGPWGTAWQLHFNDRTWHAVGRTGRGRRWAEMLAFRNLVLVYDAPVRPSPAEQRTEANAREMRASRVVSS